MLCFHRLHHLSVKWPQQGEWAGVTGSDPSASKLQLDHPLIGIVNRVNVIDERAREVMVDVIERVARLEAAVFKQGNDADPFSGK